VSPAESLLGSGRFERKKKLGEGGMGVVWEAFDQQLRARVALKTLRHVSPEAVLRLKNEFRALADLHHENLISLGELFEENGEWYFTMELIDGVDLLQWVRTDRRGSAALETLEARGRTASWDGGTDAPAPLMQAPASGAFDEARLRLALVQVAHGLSALHSAGMVHRDIKPSNLMVSADGRVRLLDFGLIAAAGSVESDGRMVGTLWYMAPEQAQSRPIGPAADWYALGVILYEALTGRLPFSGTVPAILEAKERGRMEPPRQLVPTVPSDLEDLCLRLLQPVAEGRPGGAEVLRRLGEEAAELQPSAPFVGRRAELTELEAALAATRDGAVTVLLTGESGMGKSALLRRFLEALPPGCVALSGRCYERESVPYKAIDGVIDAASRLLHTLPAEELTALKPPHAGALARLFPVLAWSEDAAQLSRMEPRELRSRAVAALRELLSRLARMRRVVITIDDFHWADTDSLELLQEVMRPGEAPPILLVLVSRNDQPLWGEPRRLPLGQLSPDDAAQLAQRLQPGVDGGAIAEEAAGHPLFIGELVRSARGESAPVRLEDALRLRIQRLPDAARSLLEALAVAARPLRQSVAAQTIGLDGAELARLLGPLRSGYLVKSGDSGLEPYHDRVRAAVPLEPERTRELHLELAQALEAWGGAEPETLAIHWQGAGHDEAAATYAEQAADDAQKALAFERAARLYQLALDLGQPTAEARRRMAMCLGEALANSGRGVQAAEAFRIAADGAPADEVLELRRRSAQQYLAGGHIDEGLASIREVLAAVGLELPKSPQRALLSLLASRARLRWRGLEFTPASESTLDPKLRTRIDATYSVSLTLGAVDTIRGTDFQTRNLLYALEAGEPYRVARALVLESCFTALPGAAHKRRVDDLLHRAEELQARLDHPHLDAWMQLAHGYVNFLWGRFAGGLRHFRLAEPIFRDRCRDVAYELDSINLFALWCRYYLGQIRDLSAALPLALAECDGRGDLSGTTNLRSRVSHVAALAADDPALARAETEAAVRAWSQRGFFAQHYYALYAQAQIDLYRGEDAGARLQASWKALEKSLLLRVQFIHVEALHLRARAHLAAGRRSEARKDARRILGLKLQWAEPLALLILAGAGERALLDRAIAGCETVGLGLYAAAAKRRRGQLAEADAWMAEQRIRDPERLTAMLAPGFAP
jgi:eukaryotic-like serine/threonine-protein kinase